MPITPFAICHIANQINTYTKAERLTALLLLKTARDAVPSYALPQDQAVATEAALRLAAKEIDKSAKRMLLLAAEYARNGADLSVVDELEYKSVEVLKTNMEKLEVVLDEPRARQITSEIDQFIDDATKLDMEKIQRRGAAPEMLLMTLERN